MRHSDGTETTQPAVLVLRALGLGDLLTAVPALRGLRRAFPRHRITLATSSYLAPLVAEMPFIDRMVGVGELQPLPVQLDADDVAVNLHGRGPESTRLLIDTSASRLVAFAHPDIPATFGSPRWCRREHEVTRWCRLLQENGIPADTSDLALPAPRRPVGDLAGVVVIHPGAASVARQWPPDRWAILAWILSARGERVVITGGREEESLAREIARDAGLPATAVLARQTDVADLAAIVASAACLVSSDTGPSHLATAFGTPSVTLFGPTPPAEWGPPVDPKHRVIWKGQRGDPNGTRPDPGLLRISVEEVLEELDELPPFSSRLRAGLRR